MGEKNPGVLSLQDFQFLEDKDPRGIYEKKTLKRLYEAIAKLDKKRARLSHKEKQLWKKFKDARFGYLFDKNSRSDGILNIKGVVQIDGQFEGEIKGPDTLIIGEPASLNAKVQAGAVICKGVLRGNAIAINKIQIHETGKLLGNVITPSLEVAEGAVFKGKCSMVGGDDSVRKKEGGRLRKLFVEG